MPDVAPLLVKRVDAARLLGLGLRTFDRLDASGKIGPRAIRLSGCKLWSVRELEAWVDAHCPDRLGWLESKKLESVRQRAG